MRVVCSPGRHGEDPLVPMGYKDCCAVLVLEVSITHSMAQLATPETSGVGILTDVSSFELSPGVPRCLQLTVKDDPRPPRALGTAGYNLKLSLSAGI